MYIRRWLAMGVVLVAWTVQVNSQSGAGAKGEWRDYGGDQGYTKSSPLDQINKDNVSRLQIAWRRPAVAEEIQSQAPKLVVGNSFRSSPVMVGGVLYLLQWHRPGRSVRPGNREDDLGPGSREPDRTPGWSVEPPHLLLGQR